MLAALVFAVFWNLVSSRCGSCCPAKSSTKATAWPCWVCCFRQSVCCSSAGRFFSILRWRKFGQSVFQMASVPGVIGGQLAGVIRTSAKVRPEDGFHLMLRCVRRITTGSGKQRSTSETVLWEDEQIVTHELLDDMAEQSAIPVVFRHPLRLPAHRRAEPDDQTVWRLKAAAEVPGIDYSATFEVPVFKTPESDPNFVPERGRWPSTSPPRPSASCARRA